MTLIEKAIQLYNKFYIDIEFSEYGNVDAYVKECVKIAIENEYKSNRELLFNLRSCGVIENENTYLKRIQGLIDEEKEILNELNLL